MEADLKRLISSLFDRAACACGLERAFEMMAERPSAGLAPDHLRIT